MKYRIKPKDPLYSDEAVVRAQYTYVFTRKGEEIFIQANSDNDAWAIINSIWYNDDSVKLDDAFDFTF